MKVSLLVLAMLLSGCGTISSIYDNGLSEPLGGWARNVRRIEASCHEDSRGLYRSYGYGDSWSKAGVAISVVDYPFSFAADLVLLPITIPGHYVAKGMR